MQRAISRTVALVALALVAIVVVGWKAGSWNSPRPLIPGHAALNDCAICHAAFEDGPSGWVLRATDVGGRRDEKCMKCHHEDTAEAFPHGLLRWLSLTAGSGGLQNERCLRCHQDVAGSSSPHGLSQTELEELAARREASRSDVRRTQLALGVAHVPISIACASCHAEHRGRNANLSLLTNVKCQACHPEAFRSLADGHPDFGAYPFSRRAKIVFDHNAHITLNFEKAGIERAPSGCTGCHYVDAAGRTMLVRSFEQTCGKCHDGQLHGDKRDAATNAIELLSVPGLDTGTLRARGFDIGEWPARSARRITPFMEILIRTDSEAEAELKALQGFDLLDLENADDRQLESAAKLAWRVKFLFADLRARGLGALMPGVEGVAGGARETRISLSAIPRDLIVSALGDWFPDLDSDLARHRAGAPLRTSRPVTPREKKVAAPPLRVGPAPDLSTEERDAFGGWFRDDYAIHYRPIVHRDPFLGVWMDVVARLRKGRPGANLLDSLRASTAPGGCGKCHSVDTLPDGKRVVNWRPGHERTTPVGFTRFAHSTHLSITRSDCSYCHPPADSDIDVASAYESGDPSEFVPEFAPVARSTCVRCHDGRLATDLCTSCHNYHVSRSRLEREPIADSQAPN